MSSSLHYWLRVCIGAMIALAQAGYAQPAPPTVSTLGATAVHADNATLNGVANPWSTPTWGWFEWGLTKSFGNRTPARSIGRGSSNTNFSEVITGLVGGVTYLFRAVASNSVDQVPGDAERLTTPAFHLAGSLAGSYQGSAAWGDYDNDGWLDILQAGLNNTNSYTESLRLWQGGGGGFINIAANSAVFGSRPGYYASWMDVNNDGLLDALVFSISPAYGSSLFRNNGAGFTQPYPGMFAFSSGFSAWADFNNDGRTDLLTWKYVGRNDSTSFITNTYGPAGLTAAFGAWGDYDNDGRQDILIIGETNGVGGTPTSEIWRNTGNGFSNINAGLTGVTAGGVAWGDYDNDGLLDILLTGTTNRFYTNFVTEVWRNTGSGFSNINAGLPVVTGSAVAWGDYDNDGRLDILIAGTTNQNFSGAICEVWRNTGAGFTNANAGLPGVMFSSVAWGDYDRDGRLDIFLCGQTVNGTLISQVWRNNLSASNAPPSAPTGLAVTTVENVVTFTWNAATDAQTPASGLTYNLRAGTTPGGTDIVSPMAASNGLRRIPAMGNVQKTRAWSTTAIPLGQQIYWSVQAIDTAFAGSPFASEQVLRLGAVLLPPSGPAPPGDSNGDGIVSQSELNAVLANYYANSPWLRLTNVAGLGGTNVTFALSNSPTVAFSVEYSTNLANWSLLGPAIPRFLFIDTNAPTEPQRFYRLRLP